MVICNATGVTARVPSCDTRAGGNSGIRKWDCVTLFTRWDVSRLKLLEDSAMVKGSEVW